MDTTERITILRDGDRCLEGSLHADIRHLVTVGSLQRDHAWMLCYEEGKRAVIAMRDMFTPVLEKAYEVFTEICEMFNDALAITPPSLAKWYNPIDRHNYRKMHHMTMLRRLRCRWRTRESRRSMDGLSPKTAIIDGDPRELEVIVF